MPEMRYACRYCLSSHKLGEPCPYRRRRYNMNKLSQFRNSGRWQRTREAIRQRDMLLCRMCLTEKHMTRRKYTTANLEVHHIVPLSENMELGHDPDNLITLCQWHHQMAHAGTIRAWELRKIIKQPPAP